MGRPAVARPIRMREAAETPEEAAAVAARVGQEALAARVGQEAMAARVGQEALAARVAAEVKAAHRRLARRAHHATVWTERNVKENAAVRAFLFPAAVSRWEEAPTAATNVRTRRRVRIMKYQSTK